MDFFFNLRNKIDFALRSKLTWSPACRSESDLPKVDRALQTEFREFLDLWPGDLFRKLPNRPLVVADVGARNFSFGPVLEAFFEENGVESEVHGIELDAHRRMADFRTRAAYGSFYAKRMRNGHFHAMDFLKWEKPLDVIFLLNPFVTSDPVLQWGLPLSVLSPQQIFVQCRKLVGNGWLIVSAPNEEEFEISLNLARDVGFKVAKTTFWRAKSRGIQSKNRHGAALRLATFSRKSGRLKEPPAL